MLYIAHDYRGKPLSKWSLRARRLSRHDPSRVLRRIHRDLPQAGTLRDAWGDFSRCLIPRLADRATLLLAPQFGRFFTSEEEQLAIRAEMLAPSCDVLRFEIPEHTTAPPPEHPVRFFPTGDVLRAEFIGAVPLRSPHGEPLGALAVSSVDEIPGHLYAVFHEAALALGSVIYRCYLEERVGEMQRQRAVLAGNLQHYVRTPLSTIRSFSEMLMDDSFGVEPELRARMMRDVLGASMRVAHVCEAVRLGDQIRDQALVWRPAPTDLRSLVEGVTSSLEWEAATRDCRLRVSAMQETSQPVITDGAKIGFVLYTCLASAIHSSRSATVEVVVTGGTHPTLTVRRTGQGEAPRAWSKLARLNPDPVAELSAVVHREAQHPSLIWEDDVPPSHSVLAPLWSRSGGAARWSGAAEGDTSLCLFLG